MGISEILQSEVVACFQSSIDFLNAYYDAHPELIEASELRARVEHLTGEDHWFGDLFGKRDEMFDRLFVNVIINCSCR